VYRIPSGRFEPPGNQLPADNLAADASCSPLVRVPPERFYPFRTSAMYAATRTSEPQSTNVLQATTRDPGTGKQFP